MPYVRGDDARFLGAPTHKVAINGTWHVLKSLDWNVNGFWLSDTLGYAYPHPGVTELGAQFILNTFLEYRHGEFFYGIGAANLVDHQRYAPQPYAGGSAPIPLMGREVFMKLGFHF